MIAGDQFLRNFTGPVTDEKDFLDENCCDGLRIELMFPSCWNTIQVPSTTSGPVQALPNGVSRKAGECDIVVVHKTVIVEVGNDGVPVKTLAPVESTTTGTYAVATPPNNMKRGKHSKVRDNSPFHRIHDRHAHHGYDHRH